jgi:hypothetical protein
LAPDIIFTGIRGSKSQSEGWDHPGQEKPADKSFYRFLDVQETMKMSMQQRRDITGRQEGKAGSKQWRNFEDAMEDLDMDQDMYDDIWQRGKGMDLDMKDVKALKSGTADDGSDEDGLPIDLKEVMGVKQDK